MKKHIITVATVKGGTGKTVTAGALAQCAEMDGKRVLCIDLDTQTSLSFWLKAKNTGKTVYNIFLDEDAAGAIQKTESGIDLIPGSGNLIALTTSTDSGRRLENAIKPIEKNYDYIFIDTGPAMSESLFNAIFSANEILIPLEADLQGIRGLLGLVNLVKQAREAKPGIKYAGAILTNYDRRPIISQELKETALEYCEKYKIPYLGEVRHTVKVNEAMAAQELLFDYSPKCTAAEDYKTIYKEIDNGKGARK